MLTYLKTAAGLTLKYPRMILTIYIINLVLGVGVSILFYKIAATQGNGSLVLNKLLADFDYMVFTDFMRLHGSALKPVFPTAIAIVGVYFLLSNLWIGGVFYHYKIQPQQFKLKTFFREGWRMFGKYLLILLLKVFVLFLIFMLSGIFYFVFALIAEGGSEREYILWLAVPTAMLIFMNSVVVVIVDYAKYIIFEHHEVSIWGGFSKAVNYVFRHFRTVGLYWLIIAAGIVLGLTYLGIDALLGMRGLLTVVLMFIVQQAVVVSRVFLANVNYAVIGEFYANQPINFPVTYIEPVTDDDVTDDLNESKPSDDD